jgi:hypothetical protein
MEIAREDKHTGSGNKSDPESINMAKAGEIPRTKTAKIAKTTT